MVVALFVGVFIGLAMVLARNLWGYAYSNEEQVVAYIARMMPILAVAFVFDDLQCVLSGKCRWFGKYSTSCMRCFWNIITNIICS